MVYGTGALCFFSGTAMQQQMSTGCPKFYPSDSARSLLQECLAENLLIELDSHQPVTEMSAEQMSNLPGRLI